MDLRTFRELFSGSGQAALADAVARNPKEVDFLSHFQALSRRHSVGLSRAALEIAVLRLEALTKFPFAAKLYFTREALEQSSSWAVASYRARRFAGFARVLDLGCSAGGDALALAGFAPVVGIDLDPLRLALARANLQAVFPGKAAFVSADLRSPLPLNLREAHQGAFFDPARRVSGRRIFSVENYQPPLSTIEGWLDSLPSLGVKLSPGVRLDELSGYLAGRRAEIEFISLNGELKEAVLWFGSLRSANRRATLLPGGHTLSTEVSSRVAVTEPKTWLYEPDPAVLRAGLVQSLAASLDATQLDEDIAYLTADRRLDTPFARTWQVEAWFPFQLKRLRAYLREHNVGHVTVKKRGSPLEPEKLIARLKLTGDQTRVVFLSHLRGRPIVLVCFPEK